MTTDYAELFPDLNNSPNCLPYDKNRILLCDQINNNNYTNASWIKEDKIIAASSPLNKDSSDDLVRFDQLIRFLQMVVERKVDTIVNLDQDRIYWDSDVNREKQFGHMTLRTLEKEVSKDERKVDKYQVVVTSKVNFIMLLAKKTKFIKYPLIAFFASQL